MLRFYFRSVPILKINISNAYQQRGNISRHVKVERISVQSITAAKCIRDKQTFLLYLIHMDEFFYFAISGFCLINNEIWFAEIVCGRRKICF